MYKDRPDVQIHIMTIFDAEAVPDDYFRRYYPERFKRAQKFRFKDDRLRCLAVAYLLKEKLGLEESDLFEGVFGKLYSDKIPEHFSISHAGDLIVLAASENVIGVDIENADRLADRDGESIIEPIAEQVFTAQEREWMLNGQDSGIRHERFLKLWTMKECISKATGRGMNMHFEEFSVLPLVTDEEYTCLELDGIYYRGESRMKGNYCLSVAIEECSNVVIEDGKTDFSC